MRHNIALSSCRLSLDHDTVRLPTRRYTLRRPEYEDQFDFTTLYNDIFWSQGNEKIILLGPPHHNLGSNSPICYYALPSGDACVANRIRNQWTDRVEITAPQGTTGLLIQFGESSFHTTPQPYLGEVFNGRKALFTMSKNNNLQWIHDWALFYSRQHGCDAIVLYDNNSDQYTLDDIHAALKAAVPDGEIAVVDWAFRYGVFDGRKDKTIGLWDGFFSQFTVFEHARRRFLDKAYAVVNADIDELVLCESNSSLFEMTKQSRTGYLCYSGQWVSAHTSGDIKNRSFKDYLFLTAGGTEMVEKKWCVDPSRCPESAQWKVHSVHGMHEDVASLQVRIRHFKGINTNWDIDTFLSESLRTETQEAERKQLTIDEQLKEILEQMFTEPTVPIAAQPVRDVHTKAHTLRVKAGQLQRQNKLSEAAQLAEAACQLLPDHPGFKLFFASLLRKLDRPEEGRILEEMAEKMLISDAAWHFQLGRMYCSHLDFEKAREELQQAIRLDPLLIDPYETLADIYASKGEHDKTRELIKSAAFATEPADVLAAARVSRLYQKIDDVPSAIRCIQALLAMEPSPYGYHLLGRMHEQEGNLQAAHGALSQAIRLLNDGSRINWSSKTSNHCIQQSFWEEDQYSIMLDLGRLLLKKGRFPEGITILETVVDFCPLLHQAYVQLARAHVLLSNPGRDEDARHRHAELTEALLNYNYPAGKPGVLRVVDPLWRQWHSDSLQLDRINILCDRAALQEACAHALAVAESTDGIPATTLAAIDMLLRENRVQEAQQCLERFGHHHGTPWASFSLHANLEFSRRNFHSALAWIEKAITGNPSSPLLHAQHARVLCEAGRYEEADKAIEKGMAISPLLIEFQFQRCNLHLCQGNPQAALCAAEQALALDASHPETYAFLSRVQLALNRPKEALLSAQKAVAIEPHRAGRHLQLSQTHQALKNFPEAMAAAEEAVALEPWNPWAKLHRLKIAFDAGNLPQALAFAQDGANAHPDHAEFYIHISRVEITHNRLKAAEEAARKATMLEPSNSAAYLFLGRSIQAAERSHEAIDAFEKVLELQAPANQRATAHLWLGELHLSTGNIHAAIRSAQQANACDPTFAEAHHLLGAALDRLGMTEKAIAALTRAVELNPKIVSWHIELSNLHLRQGQHQQALRAAQAALALAPSDRMAQVQLDLTSQRVSASQQSGGIAAE